MCGFAGFIDYRGRGSGQNLADMIEVIFHRGPDDHGIELRTDGQAQLGFGFRRLSIIDLTEAGHQPMTDDQTGNLIVFNGEVYNFGEIRSELEKEGYRFKSRSDTEVILKAYARWGRDCVRRFNGMFAIVIHDPTHHKVVMIRDRLGVKPLHYYLKDDLFLFGSELKSFHRHPAFCKEIDFSSAALFFEHGYIHAPYSIFKNTFKLLPGTILEFDLLKKTFSIEKYWDVFEVFNRPKTTMSFQEAMEELEELVRSSCRYRLIADVPVGIFLSGGYDSSCVTALTSQVSEQKVRTFTIGFENPQYDESRYARQVAEHLGTEHHEYICTEADVIRWIPDFYDLFDEPFSEAVAIPNVLVSLLSRKVVKVAISADAGDEVFAGYTRHLYALHRIRKIRLIPAPLRQMMAQAFHRIVSAPVRTLVHTNRLGRYIDIYAATDPVLIFKYLNEVFSKREIQAFFRKPYQWRHTYFLDHDRFNESNDFINRILAVELLTFFDDDILHKVDMTSMHASLEVREPLVDYRIIEFAARLPSHYKLNSQMDKLPLRFIAHKYIPEKLLHRPKQGFGLPIPLWGTTVLKPYFMEVMEEKKLRQHEMFDIKMVTDLLKHYMKGHYMVFDRLWLFITFQMWYNRWMN
jgi:asparagine synthase (glutamine-hydrolysing)